MRGGAISIRNPFEDSNISGEFKNNQALGTDYGGGAIYLESCKNVILSGNFENNSAAKKGGAIYIKVATGNGNNLFAGNYSMNCVANKTTGYNEFIGGGAIYIDNIYYDALVNITGNYNNNSAPNGGAIFINQASDGIFISSGNFINNNASGTNYIGFGGAIYFNSNIQNSNISGNFENNYASEYGSAIYFRDIVKKSNISGYYRNNSAKMGAIFSYVSVQNCTISGDFMGNRA